MAIWYPGIHLPCCQSIHMAPCLFTHNTLELIEPVSRFAYFKTSFNYYYDIIDLWLIHLHGIDSLYQLLVRKPQKPGFFFS